MGIRPQLGHLRQHGLRPVLRKVRASFSRVSRRPVAVGGFCPTLTVVQVKGLRGLFDLHKAVPCWMVLNSSGRLSKNGRASSASDPAMSVSRSKTVRTMCGRSAPSGVPRDEFEQARLRIGPGVVSPRDGTRGVPRPGGLTRAGHHARPFRSKQGRTLSISQRKIEKSLNGIK